MDGVQGYNEEQIAMVVPDLLNFAKRFPLFCGPSLVNSRAAATMVGNETAEDSSSNGYDEVVVTKNTENIDAFSSRVIPVKTESLHKGMH